MSQPVFAFTSAAALALLQLLLVIILPAPFGAVVAAVVIATAAPVLFFYHRKRFPQNHPLPNDQRFRSLIEGSMDGALIFDQTGRVQGFNSAALQLFGLQHNDNEQQGPLLMAVDACSIRVTELLDWPEQEHWCNIVAPVRGETLGRRRDGSTFPAEATCTALANAHNNISSYCVLVRDMTEHRRLSNVGHVLSHCVERMSDTIIVTETTPLNEPGPRIVFVNAAIERMTGYKKEELLGKSPRILQGPDTDREALKRIRTALDTQTPSHEEILNYTRDGKPFWLEMRIVYVPPEDAHGKSYFIGIGRDVTARRDQQRRLQHSEQRLRRMNHALESVREQERSRIARDLHDDLGQTLTAMKLELGLLLEGEAPLAPLQRDKLQRLCGIADSAVDQIRDIAANLRPSLLDHAGFLAALQWCVQEANERLSAQVVLATGPGCDRTLSDEVAIGLYRILQEALTNVSRHSDAKNVRVYYAAPFNRPRLEVRDDGIGFELEQAELANSLGLLSLRERAAQLGGKLLLESAKGQGCTIIVELPEQNEKD